MKPVLIFLLPLLMQLSTMAQLQNTRWKTILPVNQPVHCIIDFKTTTVSIYTVADSIMVETMTYSINGKNIRFLKIAGESDCNTETPGTYAFSIQRDSLILTKTADDCHDRWSALDNTHWAQWKDYPGIVVDEKILAQYTGVYGLDKQHPITISLQKGILYAEGPNNKLPKSALLPITATRFFLKIAGSEMEFVPDKNGNSFTLISHEAKDYKLQKIQ
jgi:hypothetical protein